MLLRVIIEALQHRRRKRRSGKEASHAIQGGTNLTSSTTEDAPLAYSLARIWAWPALKFRCESHPHEVSALFVDKMGETILHWTCLGKPPIEVVQAILAVCPDLARIGTKVGNLPLHVAISYRASVEVIRALLAAFPEAAGLPNGFGVYPLHLLCDYGSCTDSLRAVLETPQGAATITKRIREDATASHLDNWHTTPLQFLGARMDYRQFQRALSSIREARSRHRATRKEIERKQQSLNTSQFQLQNPHCKDSLKARVGQGTNADAQDILNHCDTALASKHEDPLIAVLRQHERNIMSFQSNDYWQKAAMLVLVEYTQQPLTVQGLRHNQANLVHACAGIRNCPSFLLEFAMLLHTDDLMEKKDAKGRLPLHVAAVNHATALSLPALTTEISRYRETSQNTLRAVLTACPDAAYSQDSDGDLPLVAAVRLIQKSRITKQAGTFAWSKALQDLLDANVEALETLNLGERLYPHVWANRMTSVDTLYQSMRHHPIALQNGSHHQRIGIHGC